MRNPKKFSGATPFNYSKPTDFSHTGQGNLDEIGAKEWDGPTPYSHAEPTKKSGHDGIGKPYATGADREEKQTPHTYFKSNKTTYADDAKSKPVTKWHQKYSLDAKLGNPSDSE
jgi:hypothetical protein